MELLKSNEANSGGPIPSMGVDSVPKSFTEFTSDRFLRIAECAYYKAQARGFAPGHELEDWLQAETELLQD